VTYRVIRNGFEVVERAKTFEEAQRLMAECAKTSELILRINYPGHEPRISGNADSAYVDIMSGDHIFQREFFVIDED
jgi:hypothetical protein